MSSFSRTFFDERVQVRQLGQRNGVGYDSAVGHGFIQLSLEALSDIDAATQFPEQIGQRRGRSVDASDPAVRVQSIPSSSLSPVLTRHLQMTHGLGNDVLIRHALVGGEDAVKQHTLQERHLLGVDLSADRTRLEVGAHFVQTAGHEL